ncbi:hypothetical protein [Maridesulfovibrio hydrothermalis]|uniref:ABC-type transport auxiliary lipoprotein component domain-containing protein n=1 Tax=Maridesulfovibrio hydrothermalis AM13 = DSM 14728 TaxID=1121451 RepID=L0RAH3_9BACT|nr:hypothetical protein [Maridesulfovibrio hydrothermalis]CCO23190.1 conserved exported protein of unknown function [Maridesulfovibrio hydrothermalis AM13 = DSM 14728]
MKKLTLSILLLLSAVLILPGTGMTGDKKMKNTILQLDYTPIKITLPACPVKIAVVKFSESTPIKKIGQSKVFNYLPSTDIGSWMGQAVFKQLKSAGFNVEYFETMDDAGDNFIITGIANKVYIDRPGQLEMKYKVRIDGMVTKKNKLLFAQNYTSKQEKNMANTGDNAGKLMAGLHDVFGVFLPQALKTINEYK